MNLKDISPKVYKLYNNYQYYAWGTKNNNAFIPKFIGDEVQKDLPYAELWIGAHPKLSSKILIEQKYYSLEKIIDNFPNEILGKRVAEKFNNKLPFLLKILSAERALSIQTHPDKSTAELLHSKDPQNYPDDNHKPEIAIAIDSLNAIVGFKSYNEIVKILAKYNELADVVKFNSDQNQNTISVEEKKKFVKNIYSEIINVSDTVLIKVIESILIKIKDEKNPTKEEVEFLKQYKIFGNDVGLISILLFNFIELAQGEAIFTDAGIPHAYLKGNIIECMANSDNVVRAGLTEKFKDVETLLSILKFDNSENQKMFPPSNSTNYTYPTKVDEFRLSINSFIEQRIQEENNNTSVKIILVTSGNLIVEWKENNVVLSREFERGEAFLIPANLKSFKLTNYGPTKFVLVEVPEVNF